MVSCSGAKTTKVTGKVTYKGVPAEGAMIVFHPRAQNPKESVRPAAVVGPDGNYSLKTAGVEGAPPGDYDVTIVWEKPIPPAARKPNGDDRADVLEGRYARPGTSGLSATIQPGQTELQPFDLK
jgi:hypothetical protein